MVESELSNKVLEGHTHITYYSITLHSVRETLGLHHMVIVKFFIV